MNVNVESDREGTTTFVVPRGALAGPRLVLRGRRRDRETRRLYPVSGRQQHPQSCHQDEVINTVINSGETFAYDVAIPADEPPGLYWYHPHIHGIAEPAVQGGASGAIVVRCDTRAAIRVTSP